MNILSCNESRLIVLEEDFFDESESKCGDMECPNHVSTQQGSPDCKIDTRRYGMEVIAICESRWNGSGLSKLSTGESIIYSDIVTKTTTTSTLSFRAAIMLFPTASEAVSHAVGTNLLQHQDHDSKIQLKRKEGHYHTMPMLRYASTNSVEQEKKEEFYRQLQSTLDKTPLQLAISKF
ncbi:unnamed protein product [Heterobilharzia americana]|nr:unnamed protein product [Heterobilharzia americana]